jgi:hypothetical protein
MPLLGGASETSYLRASEELTLRLTTLNLSVGNPQEMPPVPKIVPAPVGTFIVINDHQATITLHLYDTLRGTDLVRSHVSAPVGQIYNAYSEACPTAPIPNSIAPGEQLALARGLPQHRAEASRVGCAVNFNFDRSADLNNARRVFRESRSAFLRGRNRAGE